MPRASRGGIERIERRLLCAIIQIHFKCWVVFFLSFASISMGRYVPTGSPVHRLDPRAKLVLLVGILFAVFPSNDFPSLLCGFFALWGVARLARLSLRMLFSSCRPVFLLVIFTFVFNAVFYANFGLWNDASASWGGALVSGGVSAMRLALLVLFAILLPLTTAPLELADGLEALLSPFKRFGFPAHECAMMMSVALRFIPLLMDETDRIVKAQLSRGARLDQGNPIRRMIAFFPVLIPLFVIIFKRADELALAMESRGYRGGEGRTRRRPLLWKKNDTSATIFVMFLIAFFVFSRAFLIRTGI